MENSKSISLAKAVAEKIRRGLLAQALTRQLQRVGIHFVPYYVQVVRSPPEAGPPPLPVLVFDEATGKDFRKIADLERQQRSHQPHPVERANRGDRCFVLRKDDQVIASAWCSFEKRKTYAIVTTMLPNEAYLYVMYVDPIFRGIGLAPYLRLKSIQNLTESGIDTFYSEAEYFNSAARRFQAKTGARRQTLRLYLRIGSSEYNWAIKRY